MTKELRRGAPLAALLLATAACGASARGAVETTPAPTMAGHEQPTIPAAIPDTARHTAADVRFMSAMIGHHAQAVEMSRLAPTRAASNSIRILADRIINAQEGEISTMQSWLRERGQPVPEAHAHGHAGHHEAMMPGMLTPEQMAQLAGASGRRFDELFLTFMIQHHRGAVAMVTELFRNPGAGQDETVFKFASDVNVDQTTEIARMQRMLADLVFETGS